MVGLDNIDSFAHPLSAHESLYQCRRYFGKDGCLDT